MKTYGESSVIYLIIYMLSFRIGQMQDLNDIEGIKYCCPVPVKQYWRIFQNVTWIH